MKTPRDIVEKLHAEALKTLQTPKMLEKLSGLGVDAMAMTPAEFDAVLLAKEIAVNAALVKAAGLKHD